MVALGLDQFPIVLPLLAVMRWKAVALSSVLTTGSDDGPRVEYGVTSAMNETAAVGWSVGSRVGCSVGLCMGTQKSMCSQTRQYAALQETQRGLLTVVGAALGLCVGRVVGRSVEAVGAGVGAREGVRVGA